MVYKAWFVLLLMGSAWVCNGQILQENPTAIPLTPFYNGQLEWGDFDRDGDPDLLGYVQYTGSNFSIILMENEGGTFVAMAPPLAPLADASLKWIDYDLDGYLDIIVAGLDNFGQDPVLKLYHNNQNDTFSEATPAAFSTITAVSDFSLADLDNDGDTDVFFPASSPHVFINNKGVFEAGSVGITPGIYSSAIADFDGDGLADIAMGRTSQSNLIKIYRAKGNGQLQDLNLNIEGIDEGHLEWKDFDADGDLDLIVMGTGSNNPRFKILQNNNGMFGNYAGILPQLDHGDFDWGDFNNDGLPDLLLSGSDGNNDPKTVLLLNNGMGFDEFAFSFPGLTYSTVALFDFDRDGDSDIFLSGKDEHNDNIINVYRNRWVEEGGTPNGPPSTPSDLSENVGLDVVLSWTKGQDDLLATAPLSYNIQLYNGAELVSAVEALPNGKRLKPTLGNAYLNTSYLLRNPEPGDYSWAVQAIDQDGYASSFAGVGSFLVPYGAYDLAFTKPYYNKVVLTWKDTLAAETSFQIMRRKGQDDFAVVATVPANVTTYQDSGLPSGEYVYQVRAVYPQSISASSNTLPVSISPFQEQTPATLSALSAPIVRWLDIDMDHDFDMLVAGPSGSPSGTLHLFSNNGDFTFSSGASFGASIAMNQVVIKDFDGDRDADVAAITGTTDKDISFFLNNNGSFSQVAVISLDADAVFQLEAVNIDNNAGVDLIVRYEKAGNEKFAIFLSKGPFNFVDLKVDISYGGLYGGSFSLVDFDRDNFVDILLTGSGGKEKKVLKNIQGVSFLPQSITLPELTEVIGWYDYTQDGFADLFVGGTNNGIIVHKATTLGFVEEMTLVVPQDTGPYKLLFEDMNQDGLKDLFVTGNKPKLYIHSGTVFLDSHISFPERIGFSNQNSFYLGDWDEDGDADIFFAGLENFSSPVNRFFENQIISEGQGPINGAPGVPSSLQAVIGDLMEMTWQAVEDDKSGQSEISYNLELQCEGLPLIASESSNDGMVRIVPGPGNTGNNTTYQVTPWKGGTYQFRVQALDASHKPSAFSSWEAFYVAYGPYNLVAQLDRYNVVTLQWQDSVSNEQSVIVERRKLGEPYQTLAVLQPNTTSYQDQLTDYNNIYYYRVRFLRQGIASAYSNEAVMQQTYPLPPVVSDTTLFGCAGPNYTLGATGEDVNWYQDKNLSVWLASGTTLDLAVDENMVLYLTQQINGVLSFVKKITVSYEEELPSPISQNYDYCENDPLDDIWVAGMQITWYADENKSSIVGYGNNPGLVNDGTDKIYYVTQTVGTCESGLATIVIDINQVNGDLGQHENALVAGEEEGDLYHWFLNDNLLSTSYEINHLVISEPGTYYVEIIKGTCHETSAPLLVDYLITHIYEPREEDFRAFPNPSSGRLVVDFPNSGLGGSLSLWDARGAHVMDWPVKADINQLTIEDLPIANGLYWIEFRGESGVYRKRITIYR